MKKRFTAIVLSLCLILALLPATVFAQTAALEEEASPPITVGGVDLESTAANPVAYAITDERATLRLRVPMTRIITSNGTGRL